MDLQKFTERSRGFLQSTQHLALRSGHQQLVPEHLLKVLLEDENGLIATLIGQAGGSAKRALVAAEVNLEKLPKVEGTGAGEIYVSPDLARILDQAIKLAKTAGDEFVTVERMAQAILLATDTSASKVLTLSGVTPEAFEKAIEALRKGRRADSESAEQSYDALRRYATDLTAAARNGKLDPVIGRDEEIRRTIQVLSRRTKNNPVLIGEPGVGKTAIVEGLALRIVNGDVPESLKNRRLMSLDLGQLVAGAKFRGEFEERLKGVLMDISAAAGEIILFIDELHTLVGAGRSEGTTDASNMLKPALARGELHCVGATTLNEYRSHIEKDPALARRFQPVFVSEPSVAETISILRGLKEKYELHHGVRITDNAIITAVTLSHRYIANRFLPDKAIDLIDESSARLRMEIDSKPEELDALDRHIIQLKIERAALKRETDPASIERLARLGGELAALEERASGLTALWASEKERMQNLSQIKERLDQARAELEQVQRQGNWARAGELTYGVIPELEARIAEPESGVQRMLRTEVTDNDIASVVSRWTGIPVDRMLQGERDKLLNMERQLAQRVVGQEEAIVAVSNAVRRARAGLQDAGRPIGSFLFLGPTGVGKTELTKALAAFLFDDERALLRVDMSEYMERHSVARLVGAPPGYVGYDEGGVLTEAVRRRPYQVILFDEVEKAHHDVFNLLLQVLDDGRLTDGQGRTVDFRNTLIVLTSNLGSDFLASVPDEGEISGPTHDAVMATVRQHFRPEFLNRLDEILLFRRLSRANMLPIVDIQLRHLNQTLSEHKIKLTIDEAARHWLGTNGYDPVYGARPLKRVIQRQLQNPLATMVLDGRIADGDHVYVHANDDGLEIRPEKAL